MVADGAARPRPGPDASTTIRLALAGNICRCTGYGPIVEAIGAAAVAIDAGEGTATR